MRKQVKAVDGARYHLETEGQSESVVVMLRTNACCHSKRKIVIRYSSCPSSNSDFQLAISPQCPDPDMAMSDSDSTRASQKAGAGRITVRHGYVGVGALRTDGELKVRIRRRAA